MKSLLSKTAHLFFVATFVLAQPVVAAQAPQTVYRTDIAAFADLPIFAQLQAYENKGDTAAAPVADVDGDLSTLRDFVQVADASDGSYASADAAAPNDAVHAAAQDGVPAGAGADDYAVLSDFLNGVDPQQPAPMSVGAKPPADLIHSSVFGAAAAPADDYAVLRDFADSADGAKSTVVAAAATAEKAKAPKKLEAAAAGDETATYVGSEACVKCHKNQFGAFSATLHGSIFLKQPRTAMEKQGCESCHGPASAHIKSKEGDNGAKGDIISFRKDSPRPVEERNAICLTCHEKADRTYWNGSTHESRGLACTNCHQIMEKVSVKNQMVKSTELETCFQCHKDRRAQLSRSAHMPVANGDMSCSTCHNPHGSATDKLLRGASVNETCYKCHADKRGPFLWEHQPVRDNCVNCHEPHGTINEYMLKIQRPRLCQSCHMGPGHGNPGNPMTVQSVNRSCQNCHTLVHGSNSPAGMLFQR